MKILAFGASNSKESINKILAEYTAKQFENAEVELLDLNDYEMPIFSVDREKHDGIPTLALRFAEKIDASDLLIISFAEYNSTYTTAFKNIFDWISRIKDRKHFGEKGNQINLLFWMFISFIFLMLISGLIGYAVGYLGAKYNLLDAKELVDYK